MSEIEFTSTEEILISITWILTFFVLLLTVLHLHGETSAYFYALGWVGSFLFLIHWVKIVELLKVKK